MSLSKPADPRVRSGMTVVKEIFRDKPQIKTEVILRLKNRPLPLLDESQWKVYFVQNWDEVLEVLRGMDEGAAITDAIEALSRARARLNQPKEGDPDFDPIIHEGSRDSRLVTIIRYPKLDKLAEVAEKLDWNVRELKWVDQRQQFALLPKTYSRVAQRVLAFFSAFDAIVSENLAGFFLGEVKIQEARLFYQQQIRIEGVHERTYVALIDNLLDDLALIYELKTSVQNSPLIKEKADWVKNFVTSDKPFCERLFAFACIEGISFAGAFCVLYYLKAKMNGTVQVLTYSNELIQRDETLHFVFASMLHMALKFKCPMERAREILLSLLEVEFRYNRYLIPEDLPGLTADQMDEYLRFLANVAFLYNGYPPEEVPYPKSQKCPFDFMEMQGLQHMNNFFEANDANYKAVKEFAHDPMAQLAHALGQVFSGKSSVHENKVKEAPKQDYRCSFRMTPGTVY